MPGVPVKVNYGDIIKEIQMIQFEVDYVSNLIKNMPQDGLMVEWGSGGSTCKWIDSLSNNQKLVTIEHNPQWYNRVSRAIKSHFGDVTEKFTFHFIPEKFIEHGYGSLIEEHPCGTDKYINPDEKIWDADIFFIDGIARATCAMMVLLKKRKNKPIIMIHDYVGREDWYSWAVQFYNVETFTDKDNNSTLCVLTEK